MRAPALCSLPNPPPGLPGPADTPLSRQGRSAELRLLGGERRCVRREGGGGGENGPPPAGPDASLRARRSRAGPAERRRGAARPLRLLRPGAFRRLPRRPAPAGLPAAAAGGAGGEEGAGGGERGASRSPPAPATAAPLAAGAPRPVFPVRPRLLRPGGGRAGGTGAAAPPGQRGEDGGGSGGRGPRGWTPLPGLLPAGLAPGGWG